MEINFWNTVKVGWLGARSCPQAENPLRQAAALILNDFPNKRHSLAVAASLTFRTL
jgi:hypothetical protein